MIIATRQRDTACLELWFYEQQGSRYHLRLTRLAVALIFVPFVLSIIAIAAIFFYQNNTPLEEPNINISVSPRPDYSPQILIKPAPPASPPPRERSRTNINTNSQAITPTPVRNVNER